MLVFVKENALLRYFLNFFLQVVLKQKYYTYSNL